MIKSNKTDSNGELIEYITFEYYENGNYRKVMTYDGNGNFLYGSEYDEQGYEHGVWPES